MLFFKTDSNAPISTKKKKKIQNEEAKLKNLGLF